MFDFNFNWDWTGWNLDALNEPAPVLDNTWLAQVEREIAALSTVVTEAVVNSPAVIEAPVNREPEIARVEQAVQQVVQAVAPVVAPSLPDYILQLTTPLFIDEIAYSPEVLAAPVGQTVTPQAVETIVQNIVDTAVKDETFVNSVVASIPQSVIDRLPEEDRPVIAETINQAIETVQQSPEVPDTFASYASFKQKEMADAYGVAPGATVPVVDEQTKAQEMAAQAPSVEEIQPIIEEVISTVVDTPAVINAPENVAPKLPAVEKEVEKALQEVLASLPEKLYLEPADIEAIKQDIAETIVSSPEVIESPKGETISSEAISTIVEDVVPNIPETVYTPTAVAPEPQPVAPTPSELQPVIEEVVSTVVDTPVVVNTPENVSPNLATVEKEVAKALEEVLASLPSKLYLEPEYIEAIKQDIAETIVSSPEIIESPKGETVSNEVITQIVEDAAPLPTYTAKQESMLPTQSVQAGGTNATIQSFREKEAADEVAFKATQTPVVDEQTKMQQQAAQTPAATTGIVTPTPEPTPTPTETPAVTPPPAPTETPAEPQNFTGRGIKNQYTEDPLLLNGQPFTGNRNGIEYKNGFAVDATRADILEADRKAAEAAEAAARAASNPLYNFQQRPAAPEPDDNYVYYYSWIGGVNTGNWELYRAANTPDNLAKYLGRSVGGTTQAQPGSAVGANSLQNQPTVNPEGVITNPGAGNTVPGPGTGAIPTPGGTTGGTTGGGTTTTGTAGTGIPTPTFPTVTPTTPTTTTTTTGVTAGTTTGTALSGNRLSIYTILADRFAKYGLSSLAGKIRDLAIDGATEDTITIQLQETPEYQMRFKANQERIKKGLTVLSPAEYLGVEDTYRQILRSYGLNQFDNDDYVSQFISNDISPAELSNRVVTAVQRVRNADPAISTTLRDFYGISNADLVAYVLDPNQQLQKIERQVAAAEIGTAARRQGLEAGVGVSEALAAQGIAQAEAQKGYATIADILPTAEKLSDIYGNVEQRYGQAEAEQEVFNSLASAQRRRQRLTQREIAEFSGTSGVSRVGLTSQTRGQF